MVDEAGRAAGKNGRMIWVILAMLGIVIAEIWADPGGSASSVDRIFSGAFVAFAVGFVELFLAMVVLVIRGKIDLAKVFQDKEGPVEGAVSLSRMQAFLWTLVIMVVYFHKAVLDGHGELPVMPSELLLVMGISGAVYLAGKELSTREARAVVHKAGSAAAGPPGGKADPASVRGTADPAVPAISAVPAAPAAPAAAAILSVAAAPAAPTAPGSEPGPAARLELTGGAA